MVKSTALHPAPQPAPQPPIHVPTSNWHPQPPPHPPFPPQIQYLARSSPAVKLGETVTQPVDAKPPAIEPPARPQANYFTNFLSTLLKAGVVSANATPTGAGATSKELAISVGIPKSADSSDAVIRDYRDDIVSEMINLNYLDSVRYVTSFRQMSNGKLKFVIDHPVL